MMEFGAEEWRGEAPCFAIACHGLIAVGRFTPLRPSRHPELAFGARQDRHNSYPGTERQQPLVRGALLGLCQESSAQAPKPSRARPASKSSSKSRSPPRLRTILGKFGEDCEPVQKVKGLLEILVVRCPGLPRHPWLWRPSPHVRV